MTASSNEKVPIGRSSGTWVPPPSPASLPAHCAAQTIRKSRDGVWGEAVVPVTSAADPVGPAAALPRNSNSSCPLGRPRLSSNSCSMSELAQPYVDFALPQRRVPSRSSDPHGPPTWAQRLRAPQHTDVVSRRKPQSDPSARQRRLPGSTNKAVNPQSRSSLNFFFGRSRPLFKNNRLILN